MILFVDVTLEIKNIQNVFKALWIFSFSFVECVIDSVL
jgi:hypothetical protein